MSVSIAAPASYWYLKQFPIKDMSEVVDYIVYMTYDLHGQWDYGNKFAQEGCDDGNCLRSHVNLTETEYTLAMITKAGVNANKVAVGIASYGRSFGMTDPSCTGPDCTFQGAVVDGTGDDSTADFGRCTATAGYISNAEINELIALGSAKGWYDDGSNSDMAVWNGTWVAYQSINTRTTRISYYKSLGFAGTIDWAVTCSISLATMETKQTRTLTPPVMVPIPYRISLALAATRHSMLSKLMHTRYRQCVLLSTWLRLCKLFTTML
jgi:GH18 family chitinase